MSLAFIRKVHSEIRAQAVVYLQPAQWVWKLDNLAAVGSIKLRSSQYSVWLGMKIRPNMSQILSRLRESGLMAIPQGLWCLQPEVDYGEGFLALKQPPV